MSRTSGISLLIFFLSVLFVAWGYAEPAEEEAKCQCPCPCPKASVAEPPPGAKEPPDTVELNRIAEVYEGVSFSHTEHAEMADEGCATCHHQTPPGVYKKCATCHEKRLFDENKLNVLNLKAAYHRQCITCHVEWESGPTGCTECHEIRE